MFVWRGWNSLASALHLGDSMAHVVATPAAWAPESDMSARWSRELLSWVNLAESSRDQLSPIDNIVSKKYTCASYCKPPKF